MHVCLYVSLYVCVYISISVCMRMYVCMNVCIFVCASLHFRLMYVCIYLRIYVLYACMYVCTYLCTYVSLSHWLCFLLLQVTDHVLVFMEEVIGHYGHNTVKVRLMEMYTPLNSAGAALTLLVFQIMN